MSYVIAIKQRITLDFANSFVSIRSGFLNSAATAHHKEHTTTGGYPFAIFLCRAHVEYQLFHLIQSVYRQSFRITVRVAF